MEILLSSKGVIFVYIIYNLLIFFILIIYIPIIFYKIFKGRYNKEIKERFGFYSDEIKNIFKNNKTIWIHAVSVGETVAASSIVEKVRKKFPEYKIIFSTVTETGQEMANKIINDADEIVYFPLDLSFVVKKALKTINPDLIVIMETELWPNFIKEAKKINSKIMFANGRISDKSFKFYKYLGPILKDMLKQIDFFSMQSAQDLERIVDLGAKKDRVLNSGNTKFDQTYAEFDENKKRKYEKEFKISSEQPVFVAGSTHDDEESNLINVYKKLKKEYNDLVFILAPRHIERVDAIKKLYYKENLSTVKRTKVKNRIPGREDIIVLDTIGELAQIYSIADIVFVGGSMMGKGGHNILEPAAQGDLVFFGPDMFNFKDSKRLILENEAGIQVADWKELTDKLIYFFNNDILREKKGEKSRQVILKNRGASEKNINIINSLLKNKLYEN